MKDKKEVTIYDIAQELNVSPSTVSRALRNHTSIGKEMIEAVQKVAQAKGYRPNNIAASLRNNKTDTIGVMISWINRPFLSNLISGVEEVASKAGYNVIISQSQDRYKNEVANAKALYDSRISGLVVSLAMETIKYDHFAQFIRKDIPVVFVDRVSEECLTDRVMVDNYEAGFKATKHLIEQGCRRIAHFAGAQHRNVYRERLQGYKSALKEYSLPVDESLILYGETLNFEEGQKMTEYLIRMPQPPDAIFSANDTAAVSAIQYAKQHGIKIPQELAVVGFNDDPISRIIDPPLSTIVHPAVDMGKIAARQIINHRDHKEHTRPETIILNTELVIRESSSRMNVKELADTVI